jgi:hypothetical protein
MSPRKYEAGDSPDRPSRSKCASALAVRYAAQMALLCAEPGGMGEKEKEKEREG